MHERTHIHICICICMHTYIYAHLYTQTHVYIYIYMGVFLNPHTANFDPNCFFRHFFRHHHVSYPVNVHGTKPGQQSSILKIWGFRKNVTYIYIYIYIYIFGRWTPSLGSRKRVFGLRTPVFGLRKLVLGRRNPKCGRRYPARTTKRSTSIELYFQRFNF